jgi:hypothetical protein
MTSTSSPGLSVPSPPTYGGRLFAVVLVAAWVGALAVTSAPTSGEGRPGGRSDVPSSSVVTVVSTTPPPPSSGQNTTAF